MLKQMNANSSSCAMVSNLETSKAILKRINWDFHEKSALGADKNSPFKCSEHFWGPATFVPEIPFTLIEVLSLPGSVVYDPFGGVGTTYFQTLLLNRFPIATDICKVNIKYMNCLLALFNPQLETEQLINSIQIIVKGFDQEKDYTRNIPDGIYFAKLTPWYSRYTLNQLAFLIQAESSSEDNAIKAAMWIALSCILRTASSQDRGWGCIADNVLPKPIQMKDKKMIPLFVTHVRKLLSEIKKHVDNSIDGYERMYDLIAENPMIFREDVRTLTYVPENSVDLIVTSPPYPNMTDYATSRRLSYYHIGMDPREDSKTEIGARIRRQVNGSLEAYLKDMDLANEMISKRLKKGGYACYIMPEFNSDNENNASRKRIVQKVMSKLEDFDFLKEDEFDRIIPERRRQHNAKWAKLEREKIFLYRKL